VSHYLFDFIFHILFISGSFMVVLFLMVDSCIAGAVEMNIHDDDDELMMLSIMTLLELRS